VQASLVDPKSALPDDYDPDTVDNYKFDGSSLKFYLDLALQRLTPLTRAL
jgi:hypothetical protein